MATRAASRLMVVSSALTSNSPDWRRVWSVQALSFPLLHASQIFVRAMVASVLFRPCAHAERALCGIFPGYPEIPSISHEGTCDSLGNQLRALVSPYDCWPLIACYILRPMQESIRGDRTPF